MAKRVHIETTIPRSSLTTTWQSKSVTERGSSNPWPRSEAMHRATRRRFPPIAVIEKRPVMRAFRLPEATRLREDSRQFCRGEEWAAASVREIRQSVIERIQRCVC